MKSFDNEISGLKSFHSPQNLAALPLPKHPKNHASASAITGGIEGTNPALINSIDSSRQEPGQP